MKLKGRTSKIENTIKFIMEKNYTYYTYWKVLYSCFPFIFSILFSGCIKENLDNCLVFPSVRVVTVSPEGTTPANADDIKNLVLYIFDEEGRFLNTMPATLNKTIELDFPQENKLNIVAIANVQTDNETITDFIEGDLITNGSINLKKLQDYLTNVIYVSPSDLFLGQVDVVNNRQSGKTTILEIKRIVSSMTIKIRGLKEYIQATDNNFKVVVETQYNKVDFYAVPSGSNTNYLLEDATLIWVNNISQYEIPSFNLLSSPEGTEVKIRIYHNDTLIDVISTDQEGNPLIAYNGIQSEIRINYGGSIIITLISAKWGEILIWKDFG